MNTQTASHLCVWLSIIMCIYILHMQYRNLCFRLTVKPVFHGNPKICEDIEKGLKTSVSQKMMIGSLLLRGSKYR